MFQLTIYPERYFVIDFTTANIFIKHNSNVSDKPPKDGSHNPKLIIIPFRSIKDCHMPSHRSQGELPNMIKGWN